MIPDAQINPDDYYGEELTFEQKQEREEYEAMRKYDADCIDQYYDNK